ncbi:MAG: RagB/SusD family nutrient uptake outer membrane protein, partial [Muribaculaceae bacterium]|nr:RagB/SusD family nutrient uptake outer membrane protein [Muribaculaceae bacterium]
MKAYKYLVPVIALGFASTGCNMDEEPQSSASVDMVFSSEKGIETYPTSFYNALPSPESAVQQDATADYGAKNTIGGMEVGAYTVNSSTSWSWGTLRNINFFLE